ncbi:MAG: M4 family metallopeptidase [Lewinella sp.]|uniref:M4 family metallopeptidase n=1 Tax=Lewinella sp. TaxID=2004506 RepID=UPI003D6B5DD3
MSKLYASIFSFLLLLSATVLLAQKPVLSPRPASERHSMEDIRAGFNFEAITSGDRSQRVVSAAFSLPLSGMSMLAPSPLIERWQAQPNAQTGLPDWIQLWGAELHTGTPEVQLQAWLTALAPSWKLEKPDEAFVLQNTIMEEDGKLHLVYQQSTTGVPIYGNELRAHFTDGRLVLLHGRVLPTPVLNMEPTLTAAAALEQARTAVKQHTRIKDLSAQEQVLLGGDAVTQELVVYYPDNQWQDPHLVWSVIIVPHLADRWQLMIDAHTGELLNEHNHVCHFLPPNGPEVTTATDLQGINRTIHSYEFNNNNYLIDASRSMFSAAASDMPNTPDGVIWTINGNNTSPANDNFSTTHNVSTGNFWNDPLAVSAHYNAGEAYRYFEETFNRNSINGQGGNIVSLINIAEDDGSDMDNAFWNGQAMFYGNGNTAFTSPLAKALDVAGHEISHGVVQNTANLEYEGESGALNESFADIFGAMIDRDDWQMGEEVVNPSIYPTGALRDLSNPNNGGNSLSDPGWQPAHTNQQYTGSQDNGGVHINSGIPNRAFFLLASDIGRSKAEQIYYRALTMYLTRSSQFLDLRASVVQAAQDIYGSTEANAAINAFNTVGIGSGGTGGTPTNTQSDLAVNPGNEYILYTEGNNNNLYIQTPAGVSISDPLSNLDPFSKPTITDDGSVIVFVAQDKTIQAITIDWQTNMVQTFVLGSSPIWRNVAISRDGNRLAAITDDNDNRLLIFDLTASGAPSQEFFLYNPTTAEGVATGDVQYADVLEWDHSGEYVMYDAYNIIPSQSGTSIDYWDIGFLRAWNRNADNFGDGFISKLFSSLPENTSVGNPTFAKNSPYIIALDFIDYDANSYFLSAANIETGDVGTIFENGRLNYPNYSNQDNQIIFDAEEDTFGDAVVAIADLNSDKITPASGGFIFINNGFAGARWGTWFANGQRQLVQTLDPVSPDAWAQAFPTVSKGQITLAWELTSAARLQLQIIDLAGRVVQQSQWDSATGPGQRQLDLGALAAGSYLVQLRAGEQAFSQLVVIE